MAESQTGIANRNFPDINSLIISILDINNRADLKFIHAGSLVILIIA